MKNITNELIEAKEGVWIRQNAVISMAMYPSNGEIIVEIDLIGGQQHIYFFKYREDAEKFVEKLK